MSDEIIKIEMGDLAEEKPKAINQEVSEIESLKKELKEIKRLLKAQSKVESEGVTPKLKSLTPSLSQEYPTLEQINNLIAQQKPRLPQIPDGVKELKPKRRFFGLLKEKPQKQATQMPYIKPILKEQEITITNFEVMNITRCPQCNSKLIKGKIHKEEGKVRQVVKCKNKECVFAKELKFRTG